MSYYETAKFRLTNHARIRIRERLRIDPKLGDLEVDAIINERLEGLRPQYSDAAYDYYKIPGTKSMFAVVVAKDAVITTVTKMPPHKIKTIL